MKRCVSSRPASMLSALSCPFPGSLPWTGRHTDPHLWKCRGIRGTSHRLQQRQHRRCHYSDAKYWVTHWFRYYAFHARLRVAALIAVRGYWLTLTWQSGQGGSLSDPPKGETYPDAPPFF